MRPPSTASLPKGEAPSPMAMNAGAKTIEFDVLVSSFGRYDSTTVRLLLLAQQPRKPTVACGRRCGRSLGRRRRRGGAPLQACHVRFGVGFQRRTQCLCFVPRGRNASGVTRDLIIACRHRKDPFDRYIALAPVTAGEFHDVTPFA